MRGAPDLLVEVLSPSTPDRDREIKRRIYAKYGVREYWIVDPEGQSIEVPVASPAGFDTHRIFTPGISLSSPLLPDLSLDLSKVFA